MSPQMVPPSVEYSKSIVPEAPAGLSDPGDEIETVARQLDRLSRHRNVGGAITDVVVAAWLTVSVALGEVDSPKFGVPRVDALDLEWRGRGVECCRARRGAGVAGRVPDEGLSCSIP